MSESSRHDTLILHHDEGILSLGGDTFVIAIDDTGHEKFSDPNFPVFGLGGCGFLVKDYKRLVEAPWNYMCDRFFPKITRPMHAADLYQPTQEQLEALKHFFENFQFFRIGTTITKDTYDEIGVNFIEVIGASLLHRVCEIAKSAEFDRLFIIVEESERIETKIMRSLIKKKLGRNGKEIEIELALIPKSASMPAMEVADFIIHTYGAQTKSRIAGQAKTRMDYEIIFKNVPEFLVSTFEIIGIDEPGKNV